MHSRVSLHERNDGVTDTSAVRVVPAVHGRRNVAPDPPDELQLAEDLRSNRSPAELCQLASLHSWGDSFEDARMRRATWRALARRFGNGVTIGRGAIAKHLETVEFGDGVFVGEQSFIQGRFDGRCVIGDYAWLGPQSYYDARDLVVGEYAGIGPGVRVLGSAHTGLPIDIPIIQTDLAIRPVRIASWSDVGVNAVLLPGVTVGHGAIVGAGAVVIEDVPPFGIVAGVPARLIGRRDGRTGGEGHGA
jgi:acetyltransferase-like isoleucine patch superfamily enzyme